MLHIYIYTHTSLHAPSHFPHVHMVPSQVLKQELQLETSALRRRAGDAAQRAQALKLRQVELVQRQAVAKPRQHGSNGAGHGVKTGRFFFLWRICWV